MAQQGRRRIDRVAAPDFLDDLDARTTDEIRAMREDCQAEEARLSYARRVLQGRIDIVRAEQARRRGESTGGLIEALPSILADRSSPRRDPSLARPAPVYVPEPGHDRRVDDAPSSLAELPDLDEEQLEALRERLTSDERALSEIRRRILDHLDGLQEEFVARLRDGRIDPGDLAPGGDPARRG